MPIKTTHVGSLPRPPALQQLLAATETPNPETLDAAITDAVQDVVRKQDAVGIDIINNGEQGRLAYSVGVTSRLSGFSDRYAERALPSDLEDVPDFAQQLFGDIEHIGGPVATGPITYNGAHQLRKELDRFDNAIEKENTSCRACFHTAPSPGAVRRFTATDYHASSEDYIFDVAEALQTEYKLIAEHGVQLQIDAPDLLASFTISHKDASVNEFRNALHTYIDAINTALKHVPAEQVRLHACWGNYPGPHHHDVALSDVIDLFYDANVSALIIEAANPRHQHVHHTFKEYPLPQNWSLIPGVIDVKTNIIEHPQVISDRIQRFAEALDDPSRVIAGTDCGFETVLGANFVHPDIAWKKLEALGLGAKQATERLEY